MLLMWRTIVLLVVAVWCFHLSQAYIIKDFHVKDDDREQIFLESFGFKRNGEMILQISNFEPEQGENPQQFFVLQVTEIDTEWETKEVKKFFCDSSKSTPDNNLFYGNKLSWSELTSEQGYRLKVVPKEDQRADAVGAEGLYSLFFINCQAPDTKASFKMYLEQYNVDSRGQRNYLPAGLSPLPTVYAAFSLVYFIMFFVWVFGYMRGNGGILNKVHYLMSVLVVLKFLSLLLYAVDQHYLKTEGIQGGWAIAYYIFAVLRTAFFFVVVTLIGTGWTFFKPFLSDKDKKIIMVVIPLQVLDNVAMVIIGTKDPGYFGFIAWKDIFRLVDIICCGAVLIPIIWSIKHLREASQSDGKAARNLQKLKLFRQFYLIVVSYIYFTRIIIYLLDAALPFKLLFLGDVFTETATLCFFVVVGYKFRPMPTNPYFNVEEEDAVRLEEMRVAEEE